MEAQLKELLPFLHDKNPSVRQISLSNLLAQTPKDAPHRRVFLAGANSGGLQKPKETEVIRDLKLLCRDQIAVAHDAFRALVNLSDAPLMVSALSDLPFLTFIVSYIINPQSVLADLASMLLSNLSGSATACAALLSLKIPVVVTESKTPFATQSRCGTSLPPDPYPSTSPTEHLALPLLLDAFVQGAHAGSEDLSTRKRKGELHFLASVFGNVTTSPAGRDFFITPRPLNPLDASSPLEYPLAKIIAYTDHKDTIRRGGVASIIKNCAFNHQGHRAMLESDDVLVAVPPSTIEAPGVGVLPYVLLPLAGPEEFDLDVQDQLPEALQFLPPEKKREVDPFLRLMHVETLLLLAHTRWGRDYLRGKGVYEIVRAMHEVETDDRISETIERLVMLIKGDEPEAEKTVEDEVDEDDDDDIIQEI